MTGDPSTSAVAPAREAHASDKRDSLLRFDLGIQRGHLFIYGAAFVAGLLGSLAGVFVVRWPFAILVWTGMALASVAIRSLLSRGGSRVWLNGVSAALDIVSVTVGVYATGGLGSPWFLWYVATASSAAFVFGKRGVWLASLANTLSYLLVIWLMGQGRPFDPPFLLALFRMLILFGASWFFLSGVVNLREKRREIRRLREEEQQVNTELTRLAIQLDFRTRELAEANRHIQEADRLKSQFLANMSHELRTPMNSIIGFSEILADRLDGRVEAKHLSFVKHILASGQHLLGIINDVLDLSKIEAGKMEIYAESFEVLAVIESVCQVMRGLGRTIPTFVVEVPENFPRMESDLAKFKQVLYNLLSNAMKFAPAEKPITIQVRREEAPAMMVVAVRDEGIGIDRKDHELVFQEFRQVDGTPRREFGGTGLGLALVRKFVELQGGRVWLESAPGAGSTFFFALPLTPVVPVETPVLQEEPGPRQETVMVVEDDGDAYELIASTLASAGYSPVRVRYGQDALRMARESRPIAITLDLVLPGMDGWEILKRLKADPETRHIPVVIISIVENRELGVALGADDYFLKPIDRDLLLSRLREITGGASGLRPRLLFIDDDPDVHLILQEELASGGFEIFNAFDGVSGIKAAEDIRPEVIILDLMMPGMSGFEVASHLRENPRTADIPVLVLTSKDLTGEDRLQLQNSVRGFVQKGHSAREVLIAEIERVGHRRMKG